MDIDLGKFFDTVPQDRLSSLLHNMIEDGDTESSVRKYLHSGVIIDGQRNKTLSDGTRLSTFCRPKPICHKSRLAS